LVRPFVAGSIPARLSPDNTPPFPHRPTNHISEEPTQPAIERVGIVIEEMGMLAKEHVELVEQLI
jgi:hypothetical protein